MRDQFTRAEWNNITQKIMAWDSEYAFETGRFKEGGECRVCKIRDKRTKKVWAEGRGSTPAESLRDAFNNADTAKRPRTQSELVHIERDNERLQKRIEELERRNAELEAGEEPESPEAPEGEGTEGDEESPLPSLSDSHVTKNVLVTILEHGEIEFNKSSSKDDLAKLALEAGLVRN